MPKKYPTANRTFTCPPEKCYAVRHMTPSLFVTYDTMVAMAKQRTGKWKPGMPLEFWAHKGNLANATNRSDEQERQNIDALVKQGWLKNLGRMGSHGPKKYLIYEHPEFARMHPSSCPPYRYEPAGHTRMTGSDVLPAADAISRARNSQGRRGRLKLWIDEHGEKVGSVNFDPLSVPKDVGNENEEPEK